MRRAQGDGQPKNVLLDHYMCARGGVCVMVAICKKNMGIGGVHWHLGGIWGIRVGFETGRGSSGGWQRRKGQHSH